MQSPCKPEHSPFHRLQQPMSTGISYALSKVKLSIFHQCHYISAAWMKNGSHAAVTAKPAPWFCSAATLSSSCCTSATFPKPRSKPNTELGREVNFLTSTCLQLNRALFLEIKWSLVAKQFIFTCSLSFSNRRILLPLLKF